MTYPLPEFTKAQVADVRSTYRCAVCPGRIKQGLLMCSRHWKLVPAIEQDAVYSTWGRFNRSPTSAGFGAVARTQYFEARDRAIASARSLMHDREPMTPTGAPE